MADENVVGGKYTIDITDLKAGLIEANRVIRLSDSEFKAAAAGMTNWETNADGLTAKQKSLNTIIDVQKSKVNALTSELKNVAQQKGENSKEAQELETKLNRETAALNKSKLELQENKKALKDLDQASNTAGNGLEKVSKAAASITSTGIKAVGTAVEVAAKGLAVYATAALAAATAVFKLTASAAGAADDINTLSKQTGLSTQEIQKFQYATDIIDVSIDTLTGSMAKNIKSMASAKDGTGTAAEAYKKLGVSVVDANGNMRSGQDVFNESISALGKVSNETERDALAMQLFGKSAQDLNPLILGGTEDLKKLGDSASAAGLILSQTALDKLNVFNDSLDILKANASGAGKVISVGFAGSFQGLTDIIGSSIPNLAKVFSGVFSGKDTGQLTSGLTEFGNSMLTKINAMLPNFLGGFNTVILSIVQSISATLPTVVGTTLPILISSFTGLISGLVAAIPGFIPTIISGAANLFIGLIDGLNTVGTQVIAILPTILTSVCTALVTNAPLVLNAVMNLWSGLVQGLINVLPKIIAELPKIISGITGFLIQYISTITTVGVSLFMGLVQAIPQVITAIAAAIPQIIDSVITAVTTAIPMLVQAGIALLSGLVGALPEIITAIVTAIPKIIDGLISALVMALPLIIQAGIDLFIALIENLPVIISTIVQAIPKIIGGLVNGILGSLDKIILAGVQLFVALIENMPTIVVEIVKAIPQIIIGIVKAIGGCFSMMSEAGGNLLKGLWQGISDAGKWLYEKISGFFGGVVDKIKDFFGIHSPSTLFRDEIGKYMAQGLGVGFGDEMQVVTKNMQKAIPTTFDTDVNVNTKGNANVKKGEQGVTTGGMNLTQNYYSPKALSRADTRKLEKQGLQWATVRGL